MFETEPNADRNSQLENFRNFIREKNCSPDELKIAYLELYEDENDPRNESVVLKK